MLRGERRRKWYAQERVRQELRNQLAESLPAVSPLNGVTWVEKSHETAKCLGARGSIMKVRSALKQSVLGVKIMAIVLPIALILTVSFPNPFTYIISGVTVFTFVGEVVNIIYIKRKAAKNAEFLEEKVK